MSTGTDFIKELIAGADPQKLAAFLREIKPDKVPKKVDATKAHGPVKEYTLVSKCYKCITCNSSFIVEYKMEKHEQTSIINEDGSVCTVTINGREKSLTFNCFCSICPNCKVQVKKWTREELEQKWLALIASCSFREKREAKQAIEREIKL
jgi:hypothetical protein